MTSDSDKVSKYAVLDYQSDIQKNFNEFNLPKPNLFKAFSTEKKAIKFIESKKWDLIYIDGSHDYEVVIEDTKNSIKNLSDNGILILDDSSLYTDFDLELKSEKLLKAILVHQKSSNLCFLMTGLNIYLELVTIIYS